MYAHAYNTHPYITHPCIHHTHHTLRTHTSYTHTQLESEELRATRTQHAQHAQQHQQGQQKQQQQQAHVVQHDMSRGAVEVEPVDHNQFNHGLTTAPNSQRTTEMSTATPAAVHPPSTSTHVAGDEDNHSTARKASHATTTSHVTTASAPAVLSKGLTDGVVVVHSTTSSSSDESKYEKEDVMCMGLQWGHNGVSVCAHLPQQCV